MKRVLLLMVYVFFLPSSSIAAPNLDAAVQDICKCGFPPSGQCFDDLAKKHPEIDKSSELQDIVMRRAQEECATGTKSDYTADSIRDMVGNQNLDLSRLLGGTDKAVEASKVVTATDDCSTEAFTIAIPADWQCRKQRNSAHDVTLYTNGNALNVSVGVNQGRTSCSVIPVCTSEEYALSDSFDTTLYKNPIAGTYEYAGTNKKDSLFKLTITSNSKPSTAQLEQIAEILDSFKKR